jgi:hypothetical protein
MIIIQWRNKRLNGFICQNCASLTEVKSASIAGTPKILMERNPEKIVNGGGCYGIDHLFL